MSRGVATYKLRICLLSCKMSPGNYFTTHICDIKNSFQKCNFHDDILLRIIGYSLLWNFWCIYSANFAQGWWGGGQEVFFLHQMYGIAHLSKQYYYPADIFPLEKDIQQCWPKSTFDHMISRLRSISIDFMIYAESSLRDKNLWCGLLVFIS